MSAEATRICVVSGSARPDSHSRSVRELVEATLDSCEPNVEVRGLDLGELELPVMEFGNAAQDELPSVLRMRSDARWAQGFVLITPEYHGGMSGALKNWFDFLYPELAGKFAGVLAVTGGGSGDMSIASVKTSFQWCHGFTLPFHAAARPSDFDASGALSGARVRERIERIVFDVVRFAPLLHDEFARTVAWAKTASGSPRSGFAGLHLEDAP